MHKYYLTNHYIMIKMQFTGVCYEGLPTSPVIARCRNQRDLDMNVTLSVKGGRQVKEDKD